MSYSVEIMTDTTGDARDPWGAYLFFVRWGAGEPEVKGHIETDFIVRGENEAVVRHRVGAMQLSTVKATLDGLIRSGRDEAGKPWWEVAREESDDS